jgi:hypothetical protein
MISLDFEFLGNFDAILERALMFETGGPDGDLLIKIFLKLNF